MLFARFPDDVTDEQIYDMLMDGGIKCHCAQCGLPIRVDCEIEFFACPKCGCKQGLPTDDPDNFKNVEEDDEDTEYQTDRQNSD